MMRLQIAFHLPRKLGDSPAAPGTILKVYSNIKRASMGCKSNPALLDKPLFAVYSLHMIGRERRGSQNLDQTIQRKGDTRDG
jgi:hypothetical protein